MAVKNGLVIELGEHFIRIMVPPKGSGKPNSKRSKSVYASDRAFMFMTPEGAVIDGQITSLEELAVTLTEELTRHGLAKLQNVTFSIPSSRVHMREVPLPPIKENRVKDIVLTNASDYFPVDLSTFHIAHSILGTVSETDNRLRVMVYAAPLTLLEGYFKLAAAAGLRIVSIDYAGNSQFNVYKQFNIPGVNLFVFVNHRSSYLTFLNEKNLILQRSLTFGGGTLIDEYQSATDDLSYLEVYDVLSTPGREDEIFDTMSEDEVMQALSRLGSGIARSLDYFTSNFTSETVDNIILIGPMGRLIRLKEAIANATGHETLYLDEVSEAVALLESPAQALPYLDCVGALIEPLDLMPARFVKSKSKKEKRQNASIAVGVLVCVFALLLGGGFTAYGYLRMVEATMTHEFYIEEVAKAEYAEQIYYDYVNYAMGANSILNVRNSTSSPIDNIVTFLSELELRMPSELLVLSATCTEESITMNMTVPKKSDVARVMVQLREFESLWAISVPSIAESEDAVGASTISFTVTCMYAPSQNIVAAPEFVPQEPSEDGYYEDYDYSGDYDLGDF